jgi:CheY-like chemotaxis protein
MKQTDIGSLPAHAPFNILLADDDADDRFFFDKALRKITIPTSLVTVVDGEKLMNYLSESPENLPDVLFLDLNMPRKNGLECLSEIKLNKKLMKLPVIIYSTHLHEKDAGLLYQQGAHYYIRKTDMIELTKILYRILNRLVVNKFARPTVEKFIFTMETV